MSRYYVGMRKPIKNWDGEERLERVGATHAEIWANEVARLRTSRRLSEFGRIVGRMERRLPYKMLMKGNRGKPWREAWIALNFGRATNVTHARLAEDSAPCEDFYLKRVGEPWCAYEATEALLADRKRDAEIDAEESAPQHGRVIHIEDCDIRRESDGALPSIVSALHKKSGKARNGRLVIYWNTGWLIGARAFIAGLREHSKAYRDAFAEAWVMGSSSLFRIAPDFQMVQGPPRALGSRD